MPAARRVRSKGPSMTVSTTPEPCYASPTAIEPASTTTALFPCSPSPTPRRPSHHKKRPASHIPRPPNAFILFRANFIRDRHLHSTSSGPLSNVSPTALSTIVGITWRNLPEEERQIWVERARVAREEHKILHPTYRYQPLPTAEERAMSRENKRKVKEENIVRPDLERCQAISRFLVQGCRGQALEDKVAQFDRERETIPRTPSSAVVASYGGTAQQTRSSSLPTPARRRNTRRPRSYSTSGSPQMDVGTNSSEATPYHLSYDSPFMSSPELRPGTGVTDVGLLPIAEPALPELTYDPSSPSSINLPEPQDGGFITPSHNVEASAYHPHLPFSPRGTPHSLLTPPLAMTNTDPFSSSFSSFSSWDNGHPSTEPYYQFSYFSGLNDNVITQEAHLSQTTTTNNVDPYASPIPPFELYHTLKSFEQSFHGPSTSPNFHHALQHDVLYNDA